MQSAELTSVGLYAGRYAELYDLFYSDKPYVDEAAFIDQLLRQSASRPIRSLLELACGTGTNALLMQEKGYSVIATDRSEAMLDCARRKGGGVDFRNQDMCDLDVPERPFDAVLCLFDSIGYIQTTEAVLRVLRRVNDHLASGGIFIFEFWHAPAMLHSFDPVRVRKWPTPMGEVFRITETRLEVDRSLAEVRYTVFDPRADGTYRILQESHLNRYFLREEMAGLAGSAGLEAVRWFSGFHADERITEATWHVVALLRKP